MTNHDTKETNMTTTRPLRITAKSGSLAAVNRYEIRRLYRTLRQWHGMDARDARHVITDVLLVGQVAR